MKVGECQSFYRPNNKGFIMPKMKTRRGAAKRFKLTASGKLKRNKANHRHMLVRRSNKAKRKMRQSDFVDAGDRRNVRRMLCV